MTRFTQEHTVALGVCAAVLSLNDVMLALRPHLTQKTGVALNLTDPLPLRFAPRLTLAPITPPVYRSHPQYDQFPQPLIPNIRAQILRHMPPEFIERSILLTCHSS
jgi:hypothetical protein